MLNGSSLWPRPSQPSPTLRRYNPPMLRALVIDMDGTLCESEEAHRGARIGVT